MTRVSYWMAVTLGLALIPNAWGQDEEGSRGPIIELESQVTGNREQPQVFHVVPWQTPDSPVPGYNPLQRQLDSVFGHLERDELQRSLEQSREMSDVDQ